MIVGNNTGVHDGEITGVGVLIMTGAVTVAFATLNELDKPHPVQAWARFVANVPLEDADAI